MIHEYESGNPFQPNLYPEPKFDDLSRVGSCISSATGVKRRAMLPQ